MQRHNNSDIQRIFDTLQYLIESLPDAIFAVDSKKVIVAWNGVMEKMTGIGQKATIGQSLESHVLAISGRPHRTLIDRVISADVNDDKILCDGSISVKSFMPWAYNGRGAYLWAKASLLRDSSGNIIGAIETIRDVTEWNDAERSLHDSEEKHRKLIEMLRDVVYMTDRDGILTYLSPLSEKITGYSMDDMLGHPFTNLVSPECRDRLIKDFKIIVGTEKTTVYDIEIKDLAGNLIPMEIRGVPLSDRSGSTVGRIGIARDITKRKEAEKRIQESERLYKAIFETTGTATMVVAEDATISLVNAEFEKLSGYSREELEGKKRWMDIVFWADLEQMKEENKKRRQRDPSALRNYEFRFLRKDRAIRHVFLTVSMIAETGQVIASLLDITERKMSEMLTKGQRDLAARLNKLRNLDDVLKVCAEVAIRVSQMDCGGIYLIDEETGALDLIYAEGISERFRKSVSYYPGDSPNARLVETEGPIYCRFDKLPSHMEPLKLDENLKSVAIIPIHYEAKAIACLNVASHTIEEIPGFARIALESITSQVGAAIARVKAEEALIKSEEMFRALAENSFDTIMRFDSRCRHLYTNPKVEKETGIPSGAFIGKTHSELGFPQDLVELWEGAILKVFETAQPNSLEFILPSAIWIDWSLVPEFDGNGTVKAVLASARDITDRKERELNAQKEKEHLRQENIRLRSSIKDRWRFGEIIGKSDVMQEVYELIQKAAASNVNVIIYGESGTGKELAAKAIHDTSHRKNDEFVPVNCGAIPENLLESEFFGHRKGAFTGAHADKHGYLDLANGGSLFLDEIGDLGLNIQVKLLRALEGGGYTPIGSARVKYSDFRIIAATNKDLYDNVRRGTMREDFFYRIHIVPITLPPLRERREDIPLLIENFLKNSSGENGTINIPGKIMDALYNYDWPGNVRELQNVLNRYMTIRNLDFMSPLSKISQPRLDCNNFMENEVGNDLITALERYEKNFIVKMLEQKKWHRMKAAEALGISRHTLFRKMKNYELI